LVGCCANWESQKESPHQQVWSPPSSSDHLVGAGEERGRHGEAERSRGLEVDHQFEFGRRLHWQVGWLLAPEDAVDVASGAPVLVERINSVLE
jgi:hypothetical protein